MTQKCEVAEKFIMMGHSVRKVLALIGLSVGSYYRKPSKGQRGRPKSTFTVDTRGGIVPDTEVVDMLKGLLSQKWVDYGCLKATMWLKDEMHLNINRKKVARLMKEHALNHVNCKPARPPRKHARGCSPAPSAPEVHFELDIIHLWMPERSRHALLLNCIDLFHREWTEFALGWSISHKDVLGLVKGLVEKGCTNLLIRTDNGGQFNAGALADALEQMNVSHEFIHPGTPQQNAHVESLHSILRRAFPDFEGFMGIEDLRKELEAYRCFYNNERIHSGICFYPPMTFLKKWEMDLIDEQLDKHNHRKFLRAKGVTAPPVSEAILIGVHNDSH